MISNVELRGNFVLGIIHRDAQLILVDIGSCELHDAVDTGGLASQLVDEHVGGVHVLQGQPLGNVVHALSLPVVAEALLGNHAVDFLLGGQPLTADVGLGENDAHQTVAVSREADNPHGRLWKEIVVQGDGFKGFLCGGVYGSPFLGYRRVACFVVHLGFRALGYHRAEVLADDAVGVLEPQTYSL